jgi:hypothetical protein
MAVIGPELERFGIAFDRLWDISWNRNICALQLERAFFVVEGQSVAGWGTPVQVVTMTRMSASSPKVCGNSP